VRPGAPRSLAALLVAATCLAFAVPARAAGDRPLPKELPPFGRDKPLPAPAVDHRALANGLQVWLLARPGFPKVTAELVVRGGTAADPAELAGTAEVLVAAVKEGTTRRSSRQIAEELQGVGGEMSVEADRDAIHLTAEGLARGADTLIAVLADVAQHAAFPSDEVELVKENTLADLAAREATPEFTVDRVFTAALFGEHPYRTIAPTAEAVRSLTPALLRREYARRFRPARALLLVVGDVDEPRIVRGVEQAFGGWRAEGAAAPPLAPAPAGATSRILLVDRPGSVQAEIRVGRPAMAATDPGYFPALVANTIFGGSFGSRLVANIREDKGYTYSPESRLRAYERGGALVVSAAVRTEVTAATLLEIDYELDRLGATPVTADELARAKRYQSGLYLLRNATQSDLVRSLATAWVDGLPPSSLGEFVPKVEAVTAEQVRGAGRTLFASRRQVVVIGGDAARLEPELRQFGEVERVRP
jgi:zinc protease